MVAQGNLITAGIVGHHPDPGSYSTRTGELLENYTQRSVMEVSCVDNGQREGLGGNGSCLREKK